MIASEGKEERAGGRDARERRLAQFLYVSVHVLFLMFVMPRMLGVARCGGGVVRMGQDRSKQTTYIHAQEGKQPRG